MTQNQSPTPMGGIFPFEDIRHEDERGEYWMARELMPLQTVQSKVTEE